MRKNNKGFSYVEVLLVIAIMAILITMISITMGLLSSTNVNRGAEKLSSSLDRARNVAMAKGTSRGTIEITSDGDKCYCFVGSSSSSNKLEEREQLSASPVVIGYFETGNSDMITVSPTTPLVIKYDQSTGTFLALSNGNYCERIVFTNGDATAEIVLYPATGKSELVY